MSKLKNETRDLIIGMINEGLTNAQIAEKLDVSACTVENVRRYYNDPNWRNKPEVTTTRNWIDDAKSVLAIARDLGLTPRSIFTNMRGKVVVKSEQGDKIEVSFK